MENLLVTLIDGRRLGGRGAALSLRADSACAHEPLGAEPGQSVKGNGFSSAPKVRNLAI